jgi:spectinomycin phosphotransferase
MRDAPKTLPGSIIVERLRLDWNIDPSELRYVPVGGGSHHWIAVTANEKWWITADDLKKQGHRLESTSNAIFESLKAAYLTVAELHGTFPFALPPIRDLGGEVLRRVRHDWALAVFPYIEGTTAGPGEWDDAALAERAARLVGQIHAAVPPASVRRWSFVLPHRRTIQQAFEQLCEPWELGPYAERTRVLLASARPRVETLIARYQALASTVAGDQSQSWVLTHGEPHSANFLVGTAGELYLIDWDTVKLAPRERDISGLPIEREAVLTAYQSEAGDHFVREEAIELFGLRWVLDEIGEYVRRFRRPHEGDADDQASWETLSEYLAVDSP